MELTAPRPSATKRGTGIEGKGGKPPSGAQGISNSLNKGTKKKGRKKARQRASAYQNAKTRTALATNSGKIFGRHMKGTGRNREEKHSNNNPLRYDDTIEILDSRRATTEDITADTVQIHMTERDKRAAA